MKTKTRVFITDSSAISISRIINLLAFSTNVEIVGFAQDPATTLLSLRSLRPTVLIFDIEMRQTSGLQLLRSISREFPDLIVVVLTNASHEQYRRRCAEIGVKYFFDKTSEFWKINDVLSPFPHPYQV
jgi:DNA-binding NarL/FixJ family response regulator